SVGERRRRERRLAAAHERQRAAPAGQQTREGEGRRQGDRRGAPLREQDAGSRRSESLAERVQIDRVHHGRPSLRTCAHAQDRVVSIRPMAERLTILFMPESAYGPTNNCIGIGKVLERRGHRVVFAAEASWKGKLEPLGFEEDLVDLAPPAEDAAEQDAGQFWTDFITETAPEFRKPTIEQLATFIEPVWASLIDGATYCEPQLHAILDRAQPDVIVEDNVNAFPALLTHGAPWVRIMSCNPLELKDPALPPTFSGYPIDDRSD